MLKIRRPLGRLIFNMGIAIPGKTVFLIETAPWHLKFWRYGETSQALAPQHIAQSRGSESSLQTTFPNTLFWKKKNGFRFKSSLIFFYGLIDNKSLLGQVMAWCRIGDKSVLEPNLVFHISDFPSKSTHRYSLTSWVWCFMTLFFCRSYCRINPTDTWRNNNVIIMSKRRRDVVTT